MKAPAQTIIFEATSIASMLAALLLPISFWQQRIPEVLRYDRSPGFWVARTMFSCTYIDSCRASKFASILLVTNALFFLPLVLVAVYIFHRKKISSHNLKIASIVGFALGGIFSFYALWSGYGFMADEAFWHFSLSTDPYLWLISMPLLVFGTLAMLLGYRCRVTSTIDQWASEMMRRQTYLGLMLAVIYAITALLVFEYSSYYIDSVNAAGYDLPLYLLVLGMAFIGSIVLGIASVLVLVSFRWGVLSGSIACLLGALWTIGGVVVQTLFSRYHVGYDAHYIRAEVAMLFTMAFTVWARNRITRTRAKVLNSKR